MPAISSKSIRMAGWALCCVAPLILAAADLAAATDAPVDVHARAAPEKAEKSLARLTEYFAEQPGRTDRTKARAIFVWITDRIRFDVDAFQTGHPGDLKPEAILRSRQALSSGYAALFEDLAQRAGLEAVSIPGYVKGMDRPGETDETKQYRPNHTWNAVKINGCWQLLDCTWGAGYVKAQRFHKLFREEYFLMPPEQLLMTHYPADPAWQLVPRPLALLQFLNQAPAKVGYFHLGVSQNIVVPDKNTGAKTQVGGGLLAQAGAVKMLIGPAQRELTPGREYHFLFEAPDALNIILRNNQASVPLRKNGTRFEGYIQPEPGELAFFMQTRLRPKQLQELQTYKVQK
jgi:hypothetical protein